jgi:hypothetical protein
VLGEQVHRAAVSEHVEVGANHSVPESGLHLHYL